MPHLIGRSVNTFLQRPTNVITKEKHGENVLKLGFIKNKIVK
jgi:hypothetical protein